MKSTPQAPNSFTMVKLDWSSQLNDRLRQKNEVIILQTARFDDVISVELQRLLNSKRPEESLL